MMEIENISLILEGDGTCGMRLDGGGSQPVFVSKLHRRGRAHKAGVKIGDEIISIGGISCKNLDPKLAQDLIRNTKNARVQILRRDHKYNYQPNYDDFDSDCADGYISTSSTNYYQQIDNKTDNRYPTNKDVNFFRSKQQSSRAEDSESYKRYFNQFDDFKQDDNQQIKYRKVDFKLNDNSPNDYSPNDYSPNERRIERHVTRVYIVPEYERVPRKEIQNVSAHAHYFMNKKNAANNFNETYEDTITIAEPHYFMNEQKPAKTLNEPYEKPIIAEPKSTPFLHSWKPKVPPITETHSTPMTMREEVIIWSSKSPQDPPRPSFFKKPSIAETPLPPPPSIKIQSPTVVPTQPPVIIELKPSPPPTPPPQSPPKCEESPGVIVNEGLIEAGLLTRGVVTAAGIPVEVHLEKKKLFADSSFYEDPGHKYPTIEEQIKMARKVANLLTSHTGKMGKGQKMFQKKQEQSANWVTNLDPLLSAAIEREKMMKSMMEDSHDTAYHAGTGPFDEKSRAERAKELEAMRLKEAKSLHNVVPFDLCSKLANELKQNRGKGGKLFNKRKEESKNWVASENDPTLLAGYKPYKREPDPFKKPLDFTPLKTIQKPNELPLENTLRLPQANAANIDDLLPKNRLKDMISTPRALMTPWESIVNTGNLDKAFEHLKDHFFVEKAESAAALYEKNIGDNLHSGGNIKGNFDGNSGFGQKGKSEGLAVNYNAGDGNLNSPKELKSFMPPHQPRSFLSQTQATNVRYQPIKFQPRFM